MHDRGCGENGEEADSHEQFALAQPPDQLQQGTQDEAASQHQPGNRSHGVSRELNARGAACISGVAR